MTEAWEPETWNVTTSDLLGELRGTSREKALEGLTEIIAWGMAQQIAEALEPRVAEAEQAAQSKEQELAETEALLAKRRAYRLRDQARPLRTRANQLVAHLDALRALELPPVDVLPGLREWLENVAA